MVDPWVKERIEKQLGMARIIWFALMASIGTIFFLTYRTVLENRDWHEGILLPFVQLMGGVAVLIFVASKVLPPIFRRMGYKSALQYEWTENGLRSATGSKGERRFHDNDIPKLLGLRDQDRKMMLALPPYFVSKVLQWALAEGIALNGLISAMSAKSTMIFLPFGALALIGILTAAPRFEEIEELAKTA